MPFTTPGEDRATDKWDRPTDLVPGITRAFDILIPASEVTTPKHPETNAPSAKKKIVWIPSPPDGYATYFTVVFTTAEATAATSGWPGRRAMGSRLVWRTELPNGQTVWLVASELPIDEWMRQMLTSFKQWVLTKGRRAMEEAGYSEIEEQRAFIYGRDEQAGMRWYIDVSIANPED
ncbi:MAG: hypothetical protein CYG60_15945 [Actinobacteria bacterium]|nr:MAG: hypothetical protein CYG60_15945 [Actinomycetota bacterium]